MTSLRSKLIRLAHANPELRAAILPVLIPNPGFRFYNEAVYGLEKLLSSQEGKLVRGVKPYAAVAARQTDLPLQALEERLRGDAFELESLLGDFLVRFQRIAERRAKATFAYFNELKAQRDSGIYASGTWRSRNA
jgi:hypothetical protein